MFAVSPMYFLIDDTVATVADDTFSGAFPIEQTFAFVSAVASVGAPCGVGQNLTVVCFDNSFHAIHTTVAQLDCVSVAYWTQFAVDIVYGRPTTLCTPRTSARN